MAGPASHAWESARRLAARALAFGLVSGIGLALDYGLFLLLVESGLRAGWANLISAGVAVTFVYFVSVRRIFAYQGRFLLGLFAAYVGYQVAAVAAASWAVDWLVASVRLAPVWAKAAILPFTFGANFLFMSWLTRTRPA